MSLENIKNEARNEQVKTTGQEAGKIELPADLEKQIAELTAKLEATKKQAAEASQAEVAKLDQKAVELSAANPEQTAAVKQEVNNLEDQKQNVIKSGEELIIQASEKPAEQPVENANATEEKKEMTEIKKPKNIEEITPYLNIHKKRFDQIPAEYETAVSNLINKIQNQEDKKEIDRILGISERNTKKEEIDSTRESILNKYKNVNTEYIGNGDIDNIFEMISKKYPDVAESYGKLSLLRGEQYDLKREKNQYDDALNLSKNQELLQNYFKNNEDGTVNNPKREQFMTRYNAPYRIDVVKKMIDLGLIPKEKVAKEFEDWVKDTKRTDWSKASEEERENEMKRFKDRYQEVIGA